MSRLRSKRNEYQLGTVGEALQRFLQTKSMECVVPYYASLSKQLQENISPYQFEVLRETHNKWGMPYQFGDNENMNELFPNLAKPQIRYTAPYMDNPSLANGYNAQPASHLRNDYNELLGIMEKPLSPTVVDTLPQTTLQWQGVGNRATTGMQANSTLQQPNTFGAPTLGLSHSNLAATYKPPYATDTLSVGTYNIGKVSPVALQDEARKAPQAVQEQSQPTVQYNLSPPNEYPYANDGDNYYTSAPTSVGKELTHSITHRGDRYYRSKLFGDTPNYVYLANQNSASPYSPEDLDAYLASFRERRPISLYDPSKFAGFNSISPFTHKQEIDCLALS